jgi:transposase
LDWRALERVAAVVWELDNLLATAVGVVEDRRASRPVARIFGATERPGHDSMGRVLRRWNVRAGQKRGLCVGKTKRGKGTKLMVLADGAGTAIGIHVDSASPAEVTLLAKTLDSVSIPRAHQSGRPRKRPDRLIADRAYDSNAARSHLVRRGIEPIIPCRSNNKIATHQDGRKLRRYRRRWKIERSISWLFHFRRLVVRYERNVTVYTGLVHLACALIAMRVVMK